MPSFLASPQKTLQLSQNSAARLLTRTTEPLPVTFRTDVKVLLVTYKARNGLGPSYIANSLVNLLSLRTLRSSAAGLLEIPATERKLEDSSLNIFKIKLQTYFLTLAFN